MVVTYPSGTVIFAASWCDDEAIASAIEHCKNNKLDQNQVKIQKIKEKNFEMVVAILK